MTDDEKELVDKILNMKVDFSKTILELDEEKLLNLCREDNCYLHEIDAIQVLSETLQISINEIERQNLHNYNDLIAFILKLYTLALIKVNMNVDERTEIIGEA